MNKKIMTFLLLHMICMSHVIIGETLTELREKLSQLSSAQPFNFFDLNLTESDIKILQSIVIDEQNSFGNHETIALNHYGDLDGYLPKIATFLESFGNDDEISLSAAEVIYKIVENCLIFSNYPEAWIAIRVFKKNHTYDLVRWHTDKNLYAANCGYNYKFIFSLMGESTLLCNPCSAMRAEYVKILENSHKNNGAKNRNSTREQVADLFHDLPLYKAEFGQGAMFIMGNNNIGAIHSEPVINEARIFVSIVPGNHNQIQELYKKWNYEVSRRFA